MENSQKMIINLVTSNKNKLREFKAILGNKIKINHIELAYPELRSDDPEEIAKLAARQLADLLNKNVVVEDSGLFIQALNDLPGTCSAYIHKRIGLEGILKLMRNVKNRSCQYRSAVAYCEPKKEPISFLGIEEGTISDSIRGDKGFGHDPIFIPKGKKQTYGEMKDVEQVKKFRRAAVLKLKKFLDKS